MDEATKDKLLKVLKVVTETRTTPASTLPSSDGEGYTTFVSMVLPAEIVMLAKELYETLGNKS